LEGVAAWTFHFAEYGFENLLYVVVALRDAGFEKVASVFFGDGATFVLENL
jgi:hypothetical protein